MSATRLHALPQRVGRSSLPVIGLLALIAIATTATGCGRLEALAMIEERPVTLTSAPGCRTAPSEARGWHYRAQLDLGERPDSSGAAGTVSALTRTFRTTSIDPGLSTGSFLMVLQVLVVLAAAIVGLFAIAALTKKRWRSVAVLGAVFGVLGVVTVVLGYASGSVLSIDNATDTPVRVTVDGTTVDLAPGSMTELRVSGPDVTISTEASGVPLEQLSIALDGNPIGTLIRLVFGDGRYIYSVCGANHYGMGHYTYR